MNLCSPSIVTIEVVVQDRYSGAVRLLCDLERFGLELIDFRLVSNINGGAVIRFMLSVAGGMNADLLRHRFERHPSISSVQVV